MFKSKKTKINMNTIKDVGQGLQNLYRDVLFPLEKEYRYHDIEKPKLDDADFVGPPIIMFIGQYSTGKTTFIRYLVGEDFPDIHIGPEPTTDKFIVLMHGKQPRSIPGNPATLNKDRPFHALTSFGNNFLNRFAISELPNELLKSLTIVDTPGVLSGEKQTLDRGYDFISIIQYLGEKTDRIYLIFDSHKLDISDEFRNVIKSLQPFETKIRLVLNKADRVDYQQLMRVYGALMWSLGKVFNTPEVKRVYIGSFWEQPYLNDYYKKLFESEEQDLMNDMKSLPRNCIVRRFNDFIVRARFAFTFFVICSELSRQMPAFFKDSKKAKLLDNLPELFKSIQLTYGIAQGDFPKADVIKEKLKLYDLSKFPVLKKSTIERFKKMLDVDLPQLYNLIPLDNPADESNSPLTGGVFETFVSSQKIEENNIEFNPFEPLAQQKELLGFNSDIWPVEKFMPVYTELFESLNPENGKLRGEEVREFVKEMKLPHLTLMRIWKQADIDTDGKLDLYEFGLFNYLIKLQNSGVDVPVELPSTLIPPSKRVKTSPPPSQEL